MYDELVKSLRELCEMTALCNEYSCFECPYEEKCSAYKNGILSAVYRLAADAIEELSRDLDSMNEANIALYGALPKWIPVTERLPEEREDVLVALRRGEIAVDYYQPNRWGYSDVTHWMPLSEPPKEE